MKKTWFQGYKSRKPMLIGGGLGLTAALLTRQFAGSPLWLLHMGDAAEVLPPIWLLSFLWLVSFFAVGATAGFLLACAGGGCRREVFLWRGNAFLVLAVVFSLVWYVLLFGKHYFVFPTLFLILSTGAAFVCCLSWWRVERGAGCIAFGFGLWQGLTCILHFAVLLHL